MLEIVCWKWRGHPDYRSKFTGAHVNALHAMFRRHYHKPFRFNVVTDDPFGIDPAIRVIPLWPDHCDLPSPHGLREPSCFRRLKIFSAEAKDLIGPRILSVDLDVVLTDDVTSLFDRQEDVVLLRTEAARIPYNGSLVLLTAGSRPEVWNTFDPLTSPQLAVKNNCLGSDQGWISFCLKDRGEAHWEMGPGKGGIYAYGKHLKGGNALPPDARLVSFHGKPDPWAPEALKLNWVRRHYGLHLNRQAAAT